MLRLKDYQEEILKSLGDSSLEMSNFLFLFWVFYNKQTKQVCIYLFFLFKIGIN